jgi:hypothetical protein
MAPNSGRLCSKQIVRLMWQRYGSTKQFSWRCMRLTTACAIAPATSRCSPQSFAPRRHSAFRLVERAAKLFDEGVRHRQVRKTPALAFLQNCMAVSRLDVSQIVKVHDPRAESDIQAVLTDSKLDDVRVFPLIRSGCGMPPGKRHENSSRRSLR